MERYSASELAQAAGVPRSTLEYWSATSLLSPSLTGGAYTAREFSLGLLLAEAQRMGAPGPILAALVERLEGDAWDWPEHLWITPRGLIMEEDLAPAAWVVHPRRVLAEAGPLMLLALAS